MRHYLDSSGNRVSVVYATGHAHREDAVHVFYQDGDGLCARCLRGNCEQEVHSSAGWERDVVVHDYPRMVQ